MLVRFKQLKISTFQKNLFSTVSESLSSEKPLQKPLYDNLALKEMYKTYFDQHDFKNVKDIRVGGYYSVEKNELDKYFPEGLAGDTSEDFEKIKTVWMVRSSSKFLFKMIDEYEKRINYKYNDINSESATKNVYTAIHVPGLTDRAEWNEALTSIKLHGNEIFKNPAVLQNTSIVEPALLETEEDLDNCFDRIKNESTESFPKKIVLAGFFFFEKTTFPNLYFSKYLLWNI
jgi:hypothetical protein